MAALAAEAADEAPRASMTAAPRLATVGMNVFVDPAPGRRRARRRSCRRPRRGRGRGTAWWSGCPRSSSCVIADDRRAELGGELADGAVVVEPGHGREAAGIEAGGVVHGDEGVGVGRVADDEDLDVAAWPLSASALPCSVKMAPLAASRSLRSMPGLAGHRPDEQRVVGVAEGRRRRRRCCTMPASSGNAQSSSSMAHAFERLERRRDLEQLQDHRLVGAEHRAAGDAEQEAVADLAGGPGDGDTNRSRRRHARSVGGRAAKSRGWSDRLRHGPLPRRYGPRREGTHPRWRNLRGSPRPRPTARAGHEVAVLNRGVTATALPDGVQQLVADRKDWATM